jgi:hypothetical protein
MEAQAMTDRDHFAAAALTGLVGYHSPEDVAMESYALADAMLRERERTTHDAAPAATARTDAERDRTDNAGARPGEGTGDTREPVAWWFRCAEYESVTLLREHADAMVEAYGTTPVPLYRSPTLTDEEREAIALARMYLNEAVRLGLKKQRAYTQDGDPDGAVSIEKAIAGLESARETLSKLLERLT